MQPLEPYLLSEKHSDALRTNQTQSEPHLLGEVVSMHSKKQT